MEDAAIYIENTCGIQEGWFVCKDKDAKLHVEVKEHPTEKDKFRVTIKPQSR